MAYEVPLPQYQLAQEQPKIKDIPEVFLQYQLEKQKAEKQDSWKKSWISLKNFFLGIKQRSTLPSEDDSVVKWLAYQRHKNLPPENTYQLAKWEQKPVSTQSRYMLKDVLYSSGSEHVLVQGMDLQTQRPVMLKKTHSNHFTSEEKKQYFRQILEKEAKTLGRLDLAHMVKIYDFFVHEDNAYLVMENLYEEGYCTFDEGLKYTRGGLNLEQKVTAIQQIAETIDKLYKLGLRHRDLKLENIFIPDYLRRKDHPPMNVKIIDVGLSNWVKEIKPGSAAGTLGYMAPERARGQEGRIEQEVYEVGILAYEILTEVSLYTYQNQANLSPTNNDLEFARQISEGQIRPSAWADLKAKLIEYEVPLSTAQRVTEILQKALALEPQQRYKNCEEFTTELEESLQYFTRPTANPLPHGNPELLPKEPSP